MSDVGRGNVYSIQCISFSPVFTKSLTLSLILDLLQEARNRVFRVGCGGEEPMQMVFNFVDDDLIEGHEKDGNGIQFRDKFGTARQGQWEFIFPR